MRDRSDVDVFYFRLSLGGKFSFNFFCVGFFSISYVFDDERIGCNRLSVLSDKCFRSFNKNF